MIFFIPGGAVSPKASEKVINVYEDSLNANIKLLSYPEFVIKRFNINLENYKKYFYGQLKQVKSSNNVLIGFSLGAFFALELASHPDLKISKVVLISPFLKSPKNFYSTFLSRIKNNLNYQNKGKKFSYPPQNILADSFVHGKKFIDQYRFVISRLQLSDGIIFSKTPKVMIIGKRDNVIPRLNSEELTMRNLLVYKINGNHDLITNQHKEVIQIIKKEILDNVKI